jgi:hypothetical protein
MPSQYDYLVSAELRPRLRRGDPAAAQAVARMWNRGRGPDRQIAVPAPTTPYALYDDRLLALLWALGHNGDALRALAARLASPVHDAAGVYPGMEERLLIALWTLGGDADALEEIWRRRQPPLWPVAAVSTDTPDNLLGYLWWRQGRADARDELFRRHHQAAATDASQVRALKLLQVIGRWDYLSYPDLRRFLSRSLANARRDAYAQQDRDALAHTGQEEHTIEPLDQASREPAQATADAQHLEATVPIDLRVIYKLRLSSDACPLELTAAELEHAARRNWAHGQRGTSPAESWLRQEMKAIDAWSAGHPEPTAQELQVRFAWYSAVKTDKAARLLRLRLRADQNSELLGQVLLGSGDLAEWLAIQVQDAMDELVDRVARDNRLGQDRPARGSVAAFADLEEAGRRLSPLLRSLPLDLAQAGALGDWQTNLGAFAEEFPILMKLAACLRLADWLSWEGLVPAADTWLSRLTGWLHTGRWLANISRADKAAAKVHAGRLMPMAARLDGDAGAGLKLLLCWLRHTEEAGLPPPWLAALDQVWWQAHDTAPAWPSMRVPDLANALVEAATTVDWPTVRVQLPVLRLQLQEAQEPPGLAVRDLQDGLRRLEKALPGLRES